MNLSDRQIIQNYLGGDEAAFSLLVKRYLKSVFNFLYQLARDRSIAEDLVQDTFLKAWKNLERFDQNRKFKTWLFAIAKNTAFDWLKKKKEIPFSNFVDEEGVNFLEEIRDEEILADEILERKDIILELEKALEKIPEYYRAIILLHYKEDFTLHEIAEIIGEPYNTIKSRHQRGLMRLKQAFLYKI